MERQKEVNICECALFKIVGEGGWGDTAGRDEGDVRN